MDGYLRIPTLAYLQGEEISHILLRWILLPDHASPDPHRRQLLTEHLLEQIRY